MKFVLAPDSFKGSLTAKEATLAMKRGIQTVYPDAEIEMIPMADGGEGTVQSLVDATHGQLLTATVTNPLGHPTLATYGLLGDGHTAVIEMAAASGIQYIDDETANPLVTTTYGTGELMRAAMDQGATQLILGLGGSATNDGGAGMAQALGVQLLKADGTEVAVGGGNLSELVRIDASRRDPRLDKVEVIMASDVTNPLTGNTGASVVFGPQKGATPDQVQRLDHNLAHYAEVVARDLGIEVAEIPGSGAAGGLGAGLLAFTSATVERGVEIVLEKTHLRDRVKDADVVFTGEGGMDFQTQYGKTPMGVAQAVKQTAGDLPVIALVGKIGQGTEVLYELGIDAIFSTVPGVETLDQAISEAGSNVQKTAENVARLIRAMDGCGTAR
ncbi:glycerate kinase [Levilactobacillus bambusae]|uniref:Glycerate 2-kinase n=1 Tax=Levilactobacillus bambusae TaxID=2024736 RepID=A0A2V1N1L5_9LACO|nr:glycerate kinase [Levilactobacillus bambusae]PWG00256.1 glycerate 2-kinase [Levilactobacillus bambusae]